MIFIKYQGNTELCLSTILVREFSGEPDVLTIPRPAYGEPSNKQLGYKRQILSRCKYLCRTDMIYWNIQHNAIMEHTNIHRFLDGNPGSDKLKDIFRDNWIQGWISLVWEKNRIAKWYCSHKSPVIIKLQKKPQKFKQECWQILYLRDQGTLQRNCSRWTFVRQQSRERKQKERWSTEGLIHTFQSFFLFVLFSSFDRLVSIVWLCWCSVCLLTVRNLKFECCNIYSLEGYKAFGQLSSILFSTIFLSHFIHLALLSSFWLGSDSLLLLSCASFCQNERCLVSSRGGSQAYNWSRKQNFILDINHYFW